MRIERLTACTRSRRMPLIGAALIVFQLAALLGGCGPGSGQGLDASGNLRTAAGDTAGGGDNTGDTGGGAASGNPDATLAWIQTNVFGGVCTQCHTGAGAPLGVDWSSTAATCSNIERASAEMPPLVEIKSGDTAGSYVVWKIVGQGPNSEPIVGAQMPLSNPPLSAATIQNVSDWIADGPPGCPTASAKAGAMSVVTSATSIDDTDTGATDAAAISWATVWDESLQICATCHSLSPTNPACAAGLACPPSGLVLTEDNYYGVVDGYTVMPFDLGNSELWRRVTAVDTATRMPHGLAPLAEAQLSVIRAWIESGAPLCATPDECQ